MIAFVLVLAFAFLFVFVTVDVTGVLGVGVLVLEGRRIASTYSNAVRFLVGGYNVVCVTKTLLVKDSFTRKIQ